jgi:SAM-dependent methyltransferase
MTSLDKQISGEPPTSLTPRASMLQWLQPLVEALERLQEAHPGAFGFMNWGPRGIAPFLEVVRTELPLQAGERVLDFGCGRGLLSSLFDPDSYLGIDIVPGLVTYAQGRHASHAYAVMNGTTLALRDGQFDAVLIFGVLHHLTDDQALTALQEIRRVLKPGGRLLVVEPIPVVSRWNIVSRILKGLDLGDFIRPYEAWSSLIGNTFSVKQCRHQRIALNDLVILECFR